MEAVCGFKDSRGKFWDTKEQCIESDARIEISNIKEAFFKKWLEKHHIPEYIFRHRKANYYYESSLIYHGYSKCYTYYYDRREWEFYWKAIVNLASDYNQYARLKTLFKEIGEVIEKVPEETQEVLSRELNIVYKIEDKPWWKFW